MYTAHPAAILRNSDGVWIPIDDGNADYAAYLEWRSEGNTPDAPPAPPLSAVVARVLDEARTRRAAFFLVADGLQLSALTAGRVEEAQLIETIKQGLRDITKLPLAEAEEYEAMRRMVLDRYKQLTSNAPPALKASFMEAMT